MTFKQAQELLDSIETERKPGAAVIRQLGNGECVVIVVKSQFYCWDQHDWHTYQESQEAKQRRKRTGLGAAI